MRFATLLSIAFLGLASSARAQETQVDPYEYYPLKVGATWTYRATGNITVTVKVVRTGKNPQLGPGEFGEVQTSIDGRVLASEVINVHTDGISRWYLDEKRVEPPFKMLALPIVQDPEKKKPTTTWKIDSKIKIDEKKTEAITGTFTVDILETLKLAVDPQPLMNLYVVTSKDMSLDGKKITLNYTFAPKYGIVKQDMVLGKTTITMELTKFEPGKDPAKQ